MTENSYVTPRMEVVEIEVENIILASENPNMNPYDMNP
jgi:hypothetical protein